MHEHPNPCETCKKIGAPTEGMTKMCRHCAGNFCFGHVTAHEGQCDGPMNRDD
jgi:hypothetical protein